MTSPDLMPFTRRLIALTTRAAVSLTAAVIVFSGCSSHRIDPAVGDGVRHSPTLVRLEAQRLRMVDQRLQDSLLVDSLLRQPYSDLRARTALAVGQVRISSRYAALRRLMFDADTVVAANAAYALGIARDTSSLVELVRAVAGAPDVVAREAAWALGEIGEPARGVLTDALAPGGRAPSVRTGIAAARSSSVRAALVMATVKLRPLPAGTILPWLSDSSVEVARAAAYVIGRVRSPAGVRAMLGVRSHVDEEVRQHVARALAKTSAGDSLADEARTALRVLVRDTSERVRVNAARSLATYGPQVADAFEPLFSDPAPNVRIAASEGAGEALGDSPARWQKAWNSDTNLTFRRTLLSHIRRLGVEVAPDIEKEWSVHSDWQYRVAALSVGARSDSSLALKLAGDADKRVARAAVARLGRRPARQPVSDSSTESQRAELLPRALEEYESVVRDYVLRSRPIHAMIDTDHGTVTLELHGDDAPLVVEAFVRLARNGTYRNTHFHRVVPNFVVQDGDSAGDGSGSAGFRLRESWTRRRHQRGCVGLATAGPDTGGSQYYLCHSAQPHLDGAYTVFGQVVDGFDVMDRIVQGDRMLRIRIGK